MNLHYLNEMEIGDAAVIQSVETGGSIRRRSDRSGICKRNSHPMCSEGASGESAAYLIRGTVIALRREDSSSIQITSVKNHKSTP